MREKERVADQMIAQANTLQSELEYVRKDNMRLRELLQQLEKEREQAKDALRESEAKLHVQRKLFL